MHKFIIIAIILVSLAFEIWTLRPLILSKTKYL